MFFSAFYNAPVKVSILKFDETEAAEEKSSNVLAVYDRQVSLQVDGVHFSNAKSKVFVHLEKVLDTFVSTPTSVGQIYI